MDTSWTLSEPMRQSFFFKTCEVVTNLHGHWMNPLLHGYMGTNECELQTPKARGSRVTRGGLRVVCPGPVVILLHFPSAATIPAPGAGQSLPTAPAPDACICSSLRRHGELRGGREAPESLPRRGRRHPRPTHRQLPPAAGDLVPGWPQDPAQQPHVSSLLGGRGAGDALAPGEEVWGQVKPPDVEWGPPLHGSLSQCFWDVARLEDREV